MFAWVALAAGSLVFPLASPPPAPTLLPVRCVISRAAALLANPNPFILPPAHELWLSGEHKFKPGLFCKQAATRTTRAVYTSHPLQPLLGRLGCFFTLEQLWPEETGAILPGLDVYDGLALATARLEAFSSLRSHAELSMQYSEIPCGTVHYAAPV